MLQDAQIFKNLRADLPQLRENRLRWQPSFTRPKSYFLTTNTSLCLLSLIVIKCIFQLSTETLI